MTTAPAAPPSPPSSSPRARRPAHWRVRFAFLALVWGFSFLFMKVGTRSFAPFQVTLGRLVFGTAVLAVAMAVKRERLPRGARTWGHLAVAGFFLNALPFSLFAYSELTIPSTLAGICNATSPLWGMVLSLVALSEDRPTRVRVAGLGLGFLGVLTVLGAWQGFHGLDAGGTAMALLASLSYPVGWIYVRRTLAGAPDSHLSLTGGQLLLATVQLAVVTPLFTDIPAQVDVLPLLAVAALGALGTGFAMLVQYGLVAEVGPTTAQMVTYFVPVIAAAAGVAVLGEELTWSTPVGAVIVLAGAALTQARPRGRTGRSAPEATATPAPTLPATATAAESRRSEEPSGQPESSGQPSRPVPAPAQT
ncbi:DMT family transporter [Streptomyces sp. PsTaAH-124]|uniref:DMT family transporter n=1 Tax=Streptomyces sp. PsTaAH-124 TaxID=1157638 RepID=UPI0003627039|nr:DMT family transporter [Streptomyces sp. PsTaAH-124]